MYLEVRISVLKRSSRNQHLMGTEAGPGKSARMKGPLWEHVKYVDVLYLSSSRRYE